MEKITEYLIQSTVNTSEVRAWEETVMLRRMVLGKRRKIRYSWKNVFIRVVRVRSIRTCNRKGGRRKARSSLACLLHRKRVHQLMILPELGGRIQMAYDKVKKRHFVYYNQVIKPALVGLVGPWISGGIEFNWPQHHRPSTYLPTDCTIEEFPDGSKTIWCSEVERMFRTKGMAGFTLYPARPTSKSKPRFTTARRSRRPSSGGPIRP